MSDAQQIAEGMVDRIINLHAANPNRTRAELAETVGLREAVETLEVAERKGMLPGWAAADALAALKGEGARG